MSLGGRWYGGFEVDEHSLEHRRALLRRLSEARTESEIAEAERETDIYLGRHPHDMDVAVAAERLAGRAARVRDPERGANRWSLAVFLGLAALIALVVFGYTRAWAPAVLAGVLIAGMIAEGVWDALVYRSEREQARRHV